MSHRRWFEPFSVRLALLWPACALFLIVVAVSEDPRADADPFPRDPVTEFRQALLQEKDAGKDKDALRYRRENLTRKAQALTSLGEMARVLLLQEWRAEGIGESAADVDRDIRDGIADRFIDGLKDVLATGDATRREAAAELISETAKSSRTLGFKADFLRKRLAGLAPELAKLTTVPEPRAQQFAAEALGNIKGDPKTVVGALENLIKSSPSPLVRRSAADALGNVVQVASQLERRVRESGRAESRTDLLAVGTFVVPAGEVGLAPDQPVEVRRLSADALQQLSSALVEMTLDPFHSEDFPPPGRPWTPEEAKVIEKDREDVAGERAELRPILDTFGKEASGLTVASTDPDAYVRIQVRRIFEDLAVIRSRLNRREASIPKGESVPAPKPAPRPADNPPTKSGVFLPPAVTPSGVPVWLVTDEKDKPAAAAKPAADVTGKELLTALPKIIAGLKDPNVRARLGAVEVLENMGSEAVPAIPALVDSLRDPDRFVRWAAARTLGRLAPRSPDLIVPGVARLLNDGDLDVEIAAATALERFGPAAQDAVTALGLRASQGDADIRIAAMKALEAIGTGAAPALPAVALNLVPRSRENLPGNDQLQFGSETPSAERAGLAAALSLLGPSPNARARVAACETLGRFGKLSLPALPMLQKALNDAEYDVRRAASEAILKITQK
jgi:HEAT repeat protein